MAKVLLSAGEASGDKHAASLFKALKQRMPDVQGIGMGGPLMREAGIDIRYDSTSIAVIGVIEVLRHYPEIRRALNQLKQIIREEKPDLLICIDYKEFNFRLARFAKAQGIKVLFYVSPQVWAWRPERVKQYGKAIDLMAVIFPFEEPFYQAQNIPVCYVGHPLAGQVMPSLSKQQAMQRFGLSQPLIGLLPGSRANEIKRMLPVMLKAVELIKAEIPEARFILNQATSVSDETLHAYLKTSSVAIECFKTDHYDVLQCCDAVMTVSGTATLEVALSGIPMLIAYRLSPITYWLGRLLINIPFIGLPNIIAGKGIVKEFIQHEANPENMAAEIEKIIQDKNYAGQMKQELQKVKHLLGEGGGSVKLAEQAMYLLKAT